MIKKGNKTFNMISVEAAKQMVREKVPRLDRQEQIMLEDATGRVLAEDVCVDMDFPPFNRCNMDGYAVVSSDGEGDFELLETVPAGAVPKAKVASGKVSKVMTGAPLPEGADAVVPVEKTTQAKNDNVRILKQAQAWENVTTRGLELKKGDRILEKGARLRPQEISMLASAGCSQPSVFRFPTVAVLATGSELIEPDEKPGPGKIRNSNSYGLMAQCQNIGLPVHFLGVVHDDPEHLREKIKEGLERDVLLLTGGMSMGDFDIAPDILRESGVHFWFERVRIKPGKPVHFGTTKTGSVVFGLPGNPVSTMVIFNQLVKPALQSLMRLPSEEGIREQGVLALDYRRKDSSREEYLPVYVQKEGGQWTIQLIRYLGSGHMMALTKANALMKIDVGVNDISSGSACEFQWL